MMTLHPPQFMGVMVWIGISGVASATLAPMLIAIIWPERINATAAIWGAIAGEATYMVVYLFTNIEKALWQPVPGVDRQFCGNVATVF